MKQSLFLLCLLLGLPAFSSAQEIDRSFFAAYDTALVIYNRSSGARVTADPALGARRLPPCSTFKIYNTLIGLDLGLIPPPDAPWYKWDGVYRDIEGWNRDLTLREAFRVSAVPAYQALARQVGPGRMRRYIARLRYGNGDISAGIDTFWLPRPGISPILISADEQVALLNRLLDGALPFCAKHVAILRDIMQAAKTEHGTLYGKTGSSGKNPGGAGPVGWFVGFLEHRETTYVFACNITGGTDPSGKAAREIVENVLKSQNLL